MPNDEIKIKNEYNLNIPRYIDSGTPEDMQDINAHLNGGIPACDVDGLDRYWSLFGGLKNKLFSVLREGYYKLNIEKDEVRSTIYADDEFLAYSNKIDAAFEAWRDKVDGKLRNICSDMTAKELISELSETLVEEFEDVELIDKYDVYEVLLSYWQEVMADDVYIIIQDGYDAAKETENIMGVYTSGKNKGKEKVWLGWQADPQGYIAETFSASKRRRSPRRSRLWPKRKGIDEFTEEHAAEGGALFEF